MIETRSTLIKTSMINGSYFVGGFKNTVTDSLIVSYLSMRGIKVTKVNIFQSRTQSDDTITRLNIETNDMSASITERRFWPRSIRCMYSLDVTQQTEPKIR